MGIKQQSDGSWHAFYSRRHPETKIPVSMRRKGIETKAAALRVEKELVLEVDKRLKAIVIPTWGEFIDEYLESCRQSGMRLKTIYNRDKCLRAATSSWNERFVDSIRSDEIRKVIEVDYSDRSPSQQKSVLQYIRRAFDIAVEKDYLARNPCPNMAFRIGDKIKKVLTEDQVRTLLNKAKATGWKWYPHYAVALYTGMRSGELYALTWDKVDLDNRTIIVSCSWNSKEGLKSTKSGDDRVVVIAPALLPVLKDLKLKTGGTGPVLERFLEWTNGEQAAELRRFQSGIGLPETRFHDLRATWCTLMLSKGIEPIKVMMMGGWKNLKTMQMYMRKAGVDIKGIADVLNLHDPVVRRANVINLDF